MAVKKLSDGTHRTTIFIPRDIKDKIPDRVNLSGLVRDLLQQYVNGKKNEGEWQKGFKELYLFFKQIMRDKSKIIYGLDLWNEHVKKMNLPLIDKLAGDL